MLAVAVAVVQETLALGDLAVLVVVARVEEHRRQWELPVLLIWEAVVVVGLTIAGGWWQRCRDYSLEISIMAYFAELNENLQVLRVVSISDQMLQDELGREHEYLGIEFCRKLFGINTYWKQTSYNTNAGEHVLGGTPFRKNYAGIGFSYDPKRDAFIPPKPTGDGWILNEQQCIWRNPEREALAEKYKLGVTRV
jgi:hypothetical protein